MDPVVSGTTVVTTLFDRNVIHVANVGDSRGILVREAAGGDKAGQVRGAPPHGFYAKPTAHTCVRACVGVFGSLSRAAVAQATLSLLAASSFRSWSSHSITSHHGHQRLLASRSRMPSSTGNVLHTLGTLQGRQVKPHTLTHTHTHTSIYTPSEDQLRAGGDPKKLYVCRERRGEILYGVLFTRSVGDRDAANNLGVIAEPEMTRYEVSPMDRFLVQLLMLQRLWRGTMGARIAITVCVLTRVCGVWWWYDQVLATDGVWDVMSNDEVAAFVAKESSSAQLASFHLVNE